MADHDIKIAGAVYPDVPAVELPINGGGTAKYVEVSDTTATDSDVASGKIYYKADGSQSTGTSSGGGGGSYPWFGPNTVYVGRANSQTINLKNDTTFDSWTASTTAATIKAASTNADWTQTCDYNNAWFFVVRAYVDVAFLAGATMKNTMRRSAVYYVQAYWPYFNSQNALANNACDSLSSAVMISSAGTRYYPTSGNISYVTGVSYGPMNISSPITFSDSGTSITGKRGAIRARCSNTYFSTARKAEVDSANTNMIYTVDVYKTPLPNAIGSWVVDNIHTDLTSGL